MTDTIENLFCPACGKNMTKVFLNNQAINVDICLDGCGGILFDNRELEKCDEAHENASEILEAIKNRTFTKTDESATRICSICETKMLKMGAGAGKVQLDYCATCGAKFLDNEEITKMRAGKKDIIPKEVLEAIDYEIENHIENITLGLRPEKSSPRRQFVENLMKNLLF